MKVMSRLQLNEHYLCNAIILNMKKTTIIISLFFLLCISATTANAQCSVCRASAESNVEQGHSVGRGLNKGILYLMSIPYVLGGAAWYVWYKNKRR